MILSTTPTIEGRRIVEYRGIVSGEAVMGVNAFKDIGAGLRNIFGGRAAGYEEELVAGRENAEQAIIAQAKALGADAIVGVDVDYETITPGSGSLLMVSMSGTAVVLGPAERAG